MIERVAKAICKSRTCEGFMCCQNPAQLGRSHQCPVKAGGYDDAALSAIEAMREPGLAIRKITTFEFAEVEWPRLIDAALSKAVLHGPKAGEAR